MLYNADHAREIAEFGISIGDRRYWGNGLGREATILFLRFAWANHPFRSFFLHTLDWNERALRCFRSTGFNEVAIVERGGERFIRMETRREWWLLWEMEGRFDLASQVPLLDVPEGRPGPSLPGGGPGSPAS